MATTTPTPTVRTAIVRGCTTTPEQVAAYLPSGYSVIGSIDDGGVVIQGTDFAGWTLDEYVLPRLASGLHFGTEVDSSPLCASHSAADAELRFERAAS